MDILRFMGNIGIITVGNNGYNSLLRNFIIEIPRTFAIFGSIAENPRGFSRNETIAKPLCLIR